jgi:hypothetical protein
MEGCGEVSVIPIEKPVSETPDTSISPEIDAALERFFAAARDLQHVAQWHDEQAIAHRRRSEQMKAALRLHGVRFKHRIESLTHQKNEPVADGVETVARR